jgi:hypothetical protein
VNGWVVEEIRRIEVLTRNVVFTRDLRCDPWSGICHRREVSFRDARRQIARVDPAEPAEADETDTQTSSLPSHHFCHNISEGVLNAVNG